MITLFKYGPFGDVSDMSPFCRKVEVYFQLMNIPYTPKISGPQKSPKQKLPTIHVDGRIISDSSVIIAHFEAQQTHSLDMGMNAEEHAIATAFQAMLEEKLYFITAWSRWADNAGWSAYQPAFQKYFKTVGVPSLMIPLVMKVARKKVVKSIWTQGIGRHTPAEIYAMGAQILKAVSDFLGDKPFLMGEQVRTIDATVFAFLSGIIHVPIETPLKRAALALPNLVSYCATMQAELDARRLSD